MNYKVSFYESLEHMLTERKANYVFQLKKLSSKITQELFKKIGGNGTGADKIINIMKTLLVRGKRYQTFNFTIPDYVNPIVANYHNTVKEIPIVITFQQSNINADIGPIFMEGLCSWKRINGKVLINRIEVNVNFSN